jgi:glutamine amidotransferase
MNKAILSRSPRAVPPSRSTFAARASAVSRPSRAAVAIVDTGICNLDSIARALTVCGAKVIPTEDPEQVLAASRVVLPGVGSFGVAMRRLHDTGLADALRQFVKTGRPLLGVCLGMQLLADCSTEFGVHSGLGLISGRVERLIPRQPGERVPHVGWNEIIPTRDSRLFAGMRPNQDFYFVHSYHFVPNDGSVVVAQTPYCGNFVSGVADGAIHAVQFHPEKSLAAGLQVLQNFVNL